MLDLFLGTYSIILWFNVISWLIVFFDFLTYKTHEYYRKNFSLVFIIGLSCFTVLAIISFVIFVLNFTMPLFDIKLLIFSGIYIVCFMLFVMLYASAD